MLTVTALSNDQPEGPLDPLVRGLLSYTNQDDLMRRISDLYQRLVSLPKPCTGVQGRDCGVCATVMTRLLTTALWVMLQDLDDSGAIGSLCF